MKYIMRAICVVLLIVGVAMLILPCWIVEGEEVSVFQYISKPADYSEVTKQFRQLTDTTKLSTRNALPIFALMLVSMVTIATAFILNKMFFPHLSVVLGIVEIIIYAINPLLKVGRFGVLGIIIGIALFVAGVLSVLIELQED